MHVPFDDAMDTFLEQLMETYRQLAMMGPTVIMGDFNAGTYSGRPRGATYAGGYSCEIHLDVQDLTASLQGQASHRHPQPGSTDSCIDLCYADPAHVGRRRKRYQDMPSKNTGHRRLEGQLKQL